MVGAGSCLLTACLLLSLGPGKSPGEAIPSREPQPVVLEEMLQAQEAFTSEQAS